MNENIEKMKHELTLMGQKAQKAARALAVMPSEQKNKVLHAMADAIVEAAGAIKVANALDCAKAAANGLSSAKIERLKLDDARIRDMAEGLRVVASQSDPVGKLLDHTLRPNGLVIEKISVPIGVIGIIYESRPNVTADAAGICLKAGNTVLLRGGSEAFASNSAIAQAMNHAAVACHLPDGAVQLLPWTDREAVKLLVTLDRYVDLIIPRGGESLIRSVVEAATIPVIKHYKGVCHIFVDADADMEMALNIIENAKYQRPSACNAVECVLIHQAIAPRFIPLLAARMAEKNITIHADEDFRRFAPHAAAIEEQDYYYEYLDLEMNAKIVKDVAEAVDHINRYGSKHSESIITKSSADVDYFFANTDSATLYHNASTRFTDGGEFGKGAEIGISTDKLHARGPMGADELTSYKYIIRGNGQIR